VEIGSTYSCTLGEKVKRKSAKKAPKPQEESMLGNIFKSVSEKGRRSDSTMEKFL